MSPQCYSDACQRLAESTGSQTVMSVEGPGLSYAGHRVRFCPSMISSTGSNASGIAALFGDLSQSTMIGRRRGILLALSDQKYFELDQSVIKGTERVHVVNHDCGDGTTPGSICALQFAAS
jgi:hypothetical protein